MIVAAVRHRADQRHLVGLAGDQRKLIGHVDAGHGRGDRSKRATDGAYGGDRLLRYPEITVPSLRATGISLTDRQPFESHAVNHEGLPMVRSRKSFWQAFRNALMRALGARTV
jgi:hypothetical protein